MSQRLTIEALDQEELPKLIRKASDIAKDIEPQIRISHKPLRMKSEEETRSIRRKKIGQQLKLGVGGICFLIGVALNLSWPLELGIFIVSYLFVGGEVVLRALKNISRGQLFDENFLMSVATIGAFAIGEYPEGVAVMLFYQIGEMFQRRAVNKSRKSIEALMDIRPEFAHLMIDGEAKKVSLEEVGIGELILVNSGEKIPLDGEVIEGMATLDMSMLTGEAYPIDVEKSHKVLSGSINKDGRLIIKVTKEFGQSTVAKILELVENASSQKAPTENFITKFARIYTPIVTFIALILAIIPPLLFRDASFGDWIYRALAFLVVSCPCALVISVPLSFFGGIGGASRNGVLIKGSNYMEALNLVDQVIFDKTGTLTKGIFKVQEINVEKGMTKHELIKYAAYAESFSNHPIALSIQKKYAKKIDQTMISERKEYPGLGIRSVIKGKTVYVGNEKWMRNQGIKVPQVKELGTIVYIAIEHSYMGHIVIADEIKKDSPSTIRTLKKMGVKKIVMLTGDNKEVAENVASQLGVDEFFAELLPDQKVSWIERMTLGKKPTGKTIFVGDGVNDGPALARADIGIAMGAMGSDVAIEAADIVLMTDEPMKIVTAMRIARQTKSIVWQNIIFAMAVKILVLILATMGMATLWEAVFGDVGVTIVAILNAMRAMKISRS